eukprot:CAMPEP_0181534012 /NCGR_PEP_ID=MMETSP1110-20121109/73473_1 /TAXON_ID=174948 /ORGANISM="Symbiodinium sp., Strain CCMP421" /LENGTH=127 /DNA_ID=CAMNT_0023665253 /DNA_START=539 /DNA_END=921 /DNA_ORIENTATION=-
MNLAVIALIHCDRICRVEPVHNISLTDRLSHQAQQCDELLMLERGPPLVDCKGLRLRVPPLVDPSTVARDPSTVLDRLKLLRALLDVLDALQDCLKQGVQQLGSQRAIHALGLGLCSVGLGRPEQEG